MNNEITTALIALATASLPTLSAFLTSRNSKIEKKLDDIKTNQQANNDATLVLLEDRIKWLCRQSIEKNYIPLTDLEALERMYTRYHALGGNGYVAELMEKVRKVPNIKK